MSQSLLQNATIFSVPVIKEWSSILFPIISAPDAYLFSKREAAVLIRRRRLKEVGACSKVRKNENVHMEFQNFAIVSFQITVNNYHYDI